MNYFCLGVLCLVSFFTNAIDIAITIDDHPLPSGLLFTVRDRTQSYIEACDKHSVKAAFFCIGKNCTEYGTELLDMLNDTGHFLASHSFSHRHLSGYTLDEFKKEIDLTERVLMPYAQFRKWFRYPFLDYGNREAIGGSREKAGAAYSFLKQQAYAEGYVTINTFDWHINACLHKALKKGNHIDYDRLKRLYVSLVKEWSVFYIDMYKGHDVVHTLLLHANDLNALYLDDILTMIKESGWNLVSPEKAFKDVSWRESIVAGTSDIVFKKPLSLDCDYLSKLIEESHVIY